MKTIIGYTSKRENQSGMWASFGEETVYQFCCNIYESKKLAKKVYGAEYVRKVKVTLREIKE